MIISKKHKYVYISVMKSGTHSMYHVLQKYFSGQHWPREFNETGAGPYHSNVIPDEFSNFYKFTVVRNPYSRAISAWNVCVNVDPYMIAYSKAIKDKSFLGFAKWLNSFTEPGRAGYVVQPMHKWLKPSGNFNKIVKLENINEEIKELPFYNSIDNDVTVPDLLSRTDKSDWKKHYTQEIADLVYNWAKKDFELYGYDRESWRND
jgi:hypothetical protein